MTVRLVPGLDPASYRRHALHGEDRAWLETNCYVDLWIELLHGLGHEPIAALPFCAAIDLEGDQFTFFKFPIADLERLYGLDVIELNIWRSLPEQLAEQVALGRAPIVELDAFFLPDTAGTSYRTGHVKTSVAVETIDPATKRMAYFHNAGYFALEGEDWDGVFREGAHASPPGVAHLPPYVEVAKLGKRPALAGDGLTKASLELLRDHLGRRPRENPFIPYRAKFERDLSWLKDADATAFHGYAFATIRQFGACFELLSSYCRWLGARAPSRAEALTGASVELETISSTAKVMQFKLARAAQGKRTVDFSPMLDDLAAAWTRGQARLDAAVAS